jgi:threonine/homoserine/homoserine lactone efflux protein
MLWLAWRIANAGEVGSGTASGRPFTFLQAAAFQWVNPKAWMIALAAIPTFTTPDGDMLRQSLTIAGAFALVGFPCTLVWALLGAGASRLLRTDRALRGFNIAMALLLVASLIPALR